MKICSFFNFGILVLLFASGCASNKEFERTDALRRDSAWPMIRAAAEMEIGRREHNTQWSYSAYYEPKEHTNGVWVVVAYGAYPNNRLGDWIDLFVRDNGEVTSYSPHLSWHPR